MPRSSIQPVAEVGTRLLLGRIVKLTTIGIDKIPCAQVRCSLNEFNSYLKMYFARPLDYWALDQQSIGGLGDTVLVRGIEESKRPTATVSHTVEKIVFKYGNIIDPVTGKRVIGGEFSDDIELRKKLVQDIVDEPFEQESLLFEERRTLQLRKLTEAKEEKAF